MQTNVLTGGLSGSQELGALLGAVLLAAIFLSLVHWLSRRTATLIVSRKPEPTVHRFPPDPTAYLRDLNPLSDDEPEATDALFDTARFRKKVQ